MCDLVEMRLDAARARFARATIAMPEHIGTWHGLAWCCIAQQDLSAAADAFNAALVLDRNFAESHGGTAVVLALQSRTEEAREAARLAQRLDGKCLSAGYALALVNGEIKDAASFNRLAAKMLGGMRDASGQSSVLDIISRYTGPRN
jgi:tetratricopeptide (TPR) repeat protein